MKLTHTRLLVDNYDECHRFYSEVMGLKARFEGAVGVYEEFDTGGSLLAIYRKDMMSEVVGTSDKPVSAEQQDPVVFCFEVDDVDRAYEELGGRGAAFVNEPHDRNEWFQRVVHLRDPDGNLIELWHPLPMP
jgi:catechol 2,3-dioxygenase-like lactoylglutathione lyase family enzyme